MAFSVCFGFDEGRSVLNECRFSAIIFYFTSSLCVLIHTFTNKTVFADEDQRADIAHR